MAPEDAPPGAAVELAMAVVTEPAEQRSQEEAEAAALK
jgi:hypothetical protein